jgi:outer membrane murein-binding lipoprotein Lpp
VWQKGGDLGAFIKNTLFAAILAVSLLTGFASFRAGGAAGQLSSDVGDLRAAILRAGVPVGALTPVAAPAATGGGSGQPIGDRRTPTPAPRVP